MKNLPFILIALLSSCAFHTGNVSTGSHIDCPLVYIGFGSAATSKLFGLGGLEKDALILLAKKDLYQKFPYKKGIKLTNLSVDYKNSFLLFYSRTLVTVSAEVYDCNEYQKDTSRLSEKIIELPLINGFIVGESILHEFAYYPDEKKYAKGILKKHLSNNKVLIDYIDGNKMKVNKKTKYETLFKTTKYATNRSYFGFEVGDTSTFQSYNSKTLEKKMKKCTVLGLNIDKIYIEYVKDNGENKKLALDKLMLKK